VNADLCRRLGQALGTHIVSPADRTAVAAAAMTADTWDDLPAEVQQLVADVESRPLSPSAATSPPGGTDVRRRTAA
jgi:hypothetical protein